MGTKEEGGKEKAAVSLGAVTSKLCPADGFFNGQAYPTAADIAVMNICDAVWCFEVGNRWAKVDWATYPKMRALATRTAESASMKPYLEKSQTFKANPMGL